jgi:tRNA pseudouridine55 synthase
LGVSGFQVEEAVTLVQLQTLEGDALDAVLRPADAMILDLPEIALDVEAEWQLTHGQPVWLPRLKVDDVYRIYGAKGLFLGVAHVNAEGKLAPKRLRSSES